MYAVPAVDIILIVEEDDMLEQALCTSSTPQGYGLVQEALEKVLKC